MQTYSYIDDEFDVDDVCDVDVLAIDCGCPDLDVALEVFDELICG